jgi:hypothetical protein
VLKNIGKKYVVGDLMDLSLILQSFKETRGYDPPVRLSLSARLISCGTVFFSHSKSATAAYKQKKKKQPAEQGRYGV